MEMLGRPGGNGAGGNGKTVTFVDDAVSVSVSGRRRNSSLSSFLDMDGGSAAARAPPPPPRPPAPHGMTGSGGRRRTYGDGELDVFSAERYFRGAMDGGGDADRNDGPTGVTLTQPLPLTAAASAMPAAVEAVVMARPSSTRASTASFTAASSASAASSVNSQTALFRQQRRSSFPRDGNSKCCVRVGVLMRTCSGKRSVRVDDAAAKESGPGADIAGDAEPAAIDWYRELRMHKAGVLGLVSSDGNHSRGSMAAATGHLHLPPSLNNLATAKVAAIGGGRDVITGDEKQAAAEAEPPELTFSTSSVRRRSTFAAFVAPAVVRAANVPPAPAPASGRVVAGELNGGGAAAGRVGGGVHHEEDDDEDEAGSESSSELFEIKSLMIDECAYEPSEASIQWSVVTASAASERGDRGDRARWANGGNGGNGGGGRGPVAGRPPQHRPGGTGMLAGCASHRAVDVSAAAAMQQRRRGSEGVHRARRNGGGA